MKCPSCGKDCTHILKCPACNTAACHNPGCQTRKFGNSGFREGHNCPVCRKGKLEKIG